MFAAATLALCLAAAPPPPKEEALSALTFDNGAILASESGSAAKSLDHGSAWHLTDGDETQAWRSPEGQPLGGTFVWDLDTTWNVNAFVVSNRGANESELPGVSVKEVDLYLSTGINGEFAKVGRYEGSVGGRDVYQLPPGTQARQVKVVVVSNHGRSDFTEIGELELLGARAAAVPNALLAGSYDTQYGPIRFAQNGDAVYGCYDWADRASLIWGCMAGRVAKVVWWVPPEEGDDAQVREGTATFAVTPDNNISGVWYLHGWLSGEWKGFRLPPGKGPKCVVRQSKVLEASLHDRGRALLCGIHFDTNSDAPRYESTSVLDELAAAIQAQPKLKLLVEGHTDSTNTDDYNMGLSKRRAQNVVKLLVKRGIPPKQLDSRGFGRTRPVADNAIAQGRALNRRVEVSIVK